jgi:hypothetical protein
VTAGSSDTPPHTVDWLRGSRDYVRLVDVLAVAPMPPETERFELRFHSVTNCPGRWMDAAASVGPGRNPRQDARHAIVASLKTTAAAAVRKLNFVVDTSAPITRRLPDLGEDRLVEAISIVDGGTVLTMSGEFDVWEHVIASAKGLGDFLFPGVQWYVLYLRADLTRIPQVTAGRVMTMQRSRKRLAIDEVAYFIDGTPVGVIWVCDRAG